MGSVPSPTRPRSRARRAPAAPSQPPPSDHRIYASFCNDTTSNWIECYDPSSNGFTHMGPIPGLGPNCVLKDFAMVSLGDSIYIIGGRVVRKERSMVHHVVEDGTDDEFIEANLEIRSCVLRYDVGRDRWARCGPLSQPRCCFACCVCDGRIYVAGGRFDVAGTHGVASGEVYDPARDEWSPLPDMSVMRYKCVGVTWQGKIYVIGGFASRGDHNSGKGIESFIVERSSAEVYDTRTGKWHVVVGMWQLDVPPNQIVAANETLFSSGDCLKPWKGHIESYDGDMNMWNVVDKSHLQTCSSLVQRLYLTMAPIGSRLYFMGGFQMLEELPRTMSRVCVFDTSATSREWTNMEPIEEEGKKELCSHCCVVRIS
ncbi:unnamed protein product [Linum tenue]|uniref:Uncharacterized protein n=1 Tax=Linum tenue TaxID=586396 RepID=A0AAV0JFK7_9ROSI|nr:unnamed protein product [Linum tenue]